MRTALLVNRTGVVFKLVEEALSNFAELKMALHFEGANIVLREKSFDFVIVEGGDLESASRLAQDIMQNSQTSRLPLIYVSVERSTDELVQVFEAGFDDYIALPFESAELRARVEAKFKKTSPARGHEYFWRGDLRFAVGQQRVTITGAGEERDLELTPNEFRILYLLAINEKKILSREQILTEVWGTNLNIISRTVDKHICALRRKLGEKSHYVSSYPLQGYCFEANQSTPLVYARDYSL
jgi:DNA-binding response OmpR family regulator